MDSLLVEGIVDGEPIDGADYVVTEGGLIGSTGRFFVQGPNGTLEIAACPIGGSPIETSNANPYETVGTDATTLGEGCDVNLQVCGLENCAVFGSAEVAFEVHDVGATRHFALDAEGLAGTVHVELVFRHVVETR